MVQRELYNIRDLPLEGGMTGGRKKLTSPLVLYLINLDRSSHPRMVSSSPRIMSPPSSVSLVPTQSSFTFTLAVVKLIKA